MVSTRLSGFIGGRLRADLRRSAASREPCYAPSLVTWPQTLVSEFLDGAANGAGCDRDDRAKERAKDGPARAGVCRVRA
jgi:hypothetical protein